MKLGQEGEDSEDSEDSDSGDYCRMLAGTVCRELLLCVSEAGDSACRLIRDT